MNSIGIKVAAARKLKGLSQESLAEQSKINLRTIQRIEKGENEPRGKTLSLICDALELNIEEVLNENAEASKSTITSKIVNAFFLFILNLLFVSVIGYLTMDSNSNYNSKFGALLLSFFISIFIVSHSRQTLPAIRMFKFGWGLLVYVVVTAINFGMIKCIVWGLAPSVLIALATLYFGNMKINTK